MIGDWDESSSTFGPFFPTGCFPKCPDVVVMAVEADVRQHMSVQGLGSPLIEHPTVAATLGQITMCQGAFVEGSRDAAFEAAAKTIAVMVDECKSATPTVSKVAEEYEADMASQENLVASLKEEVGGLIEEVHCLRSELSASKNDASTLRAQLEALRREAAQPEVDALCDWLRGLQLRGSMVGQYARSLHDQGVADAQVLRTLGPSVAEETCVAAGMTGVETNIILQHLTTGIM